MAIVRFCSAGLNMKKPIPIDYKWLALLTVSIGTFMGTLDASIVNISFPRLVRIFETDASVVLWVSVAYLLVSIGLMLAFARIGDILGRKRVYIVGFALFTVGLILCSLSQSVVQLILARVVQGVGAAMTIALSMAIVTAAFRDHERGKALGILGAVVSTGLLIGPVLGGFLLDIFDWRSVFYTRVPIGVVGIVMAWVLLREQRDTDVHIKFDLLGSATLFGGLSCLLLLVNIGGKSSFISPQTGVLATCMVILLVLFVVVERKTDQPTVDLSLFRNRLFASGNISLGIMSIAIITTVFLMPFYLIDGLGYSASKAGLLMAAVPAVTFIVSPLSGWLSDKIGTSLLRIVGVVLVCLALFLLSRLDATSSIIGILLKLVVLGIGFGMFESPNSSSIMGSVSRDYLGTASAMISTSRQIGMTVGMAIAGTIFAARQLFHIAQLSHNGLNPAMLNELSLISSFQDTLLLVTIVSVVGIVAASFGGRQQPE